LMEGWSKFQGGWLHGTPLLAILNGWVDAHKPYHFFLAVVDTARAHPKIFGSLVTLGELVVGVSMLLGLFTRLGAVVGALMVLSFAFGAGQGLAPPGTGIMAGAVFLTFIAAPPGRALGIDQTLHGRLPRWLI